ncbi:hypothetical protein LOTGIDRAFT_141307 [Lottia gigantea]|uniref:Uncharacterized protein n=1 Tax=Lottia gigantea TaxID=225164 RepID=V4AYH0_LOTGI|nr:hypothetical protein LOTGIDRAFT_141307 [Lottia gigantea]ESP00131.1 hypothetical protein LOTGIDRAFT_141307 [Lottia gigantea]
MSYCSRVAVIHSFIHSFIHSIITFVQLSIVSLIYWSLLTFIHSFFEQVLCSLIE